MDGIHIYLSKGNTLIRNNGGYRYPSASKWKLFYEGKAEINKYLARVNKVYYSIQASFLLIELVILASIILLHSKIAVVSILLFFLIIIGFVQALFFTIMKSILAQEILIKFFAIGLLVFKKGVLNLSPEIVKVDKWYGRRARKIFASKKFTKDEVETFNILSEDWNGTYGDLLEAVRTL